MSARASARTGGREEVRADRWQPDKGVDVEVLWRPNAGAQTMFLQSPAREVLYGGAVSGGKTDALIMNALRSVGHPKHRSITLRREIDDLQEIIDRQRIVYEAICPKASWVDSRKRWEWPSGAFSFLGSAQRTADIESFKSFEFDLVQWDELTTFERYQYIYMLSRNRSKDNHLPLNVRAGTNPDGAGHGWVHARFVKGRTPYAIYRMSSEIPQPGGEPLKLELTRQFIPATVFDNPMVSGRDEYIAGLRGMGEQLADALLYGKWDYFRGQMFPYGKLGGLVEVDRGLKQQTCYMVRALDYGWTDATVVYWLLVYPGLSGMPDIEVVSELAVSETNVADIAHLMEARETELASQGLPQVGTSVIDPSTKAKRLEGRSILSLFEEAGLWFTPADNDRQAGWARLRNLLELGRLGVWRGCAPYLLHTLPKLVRDPRKADDIKDRQDDHGADSLRYAVMSFRDHTPAPTPDIIQSSGSRDMQFERITAALQQDSQMGRFDGLGDGF